MTHAWWRHAVRPVDPPTQAPGFYEGIVDRSGALLLVFTEPHPGDRIVDLSELAPLPLAPELSEAW